MPEYRRERFVDVSHVVEPGMVTYKGLPAPTLCDFLSFDDSRSHYSEETEFSISMIEMVANTGTYVDSPRHRYREGADLAALDLESLADLAGVVVRADTEDGRRPVHSLLLGAGIPIAEHLCNLGMLPDSGFRFHAAPVKVKGMGSFPVRAYAVVA